MAGDAALGRAVPVRLRRVAAGRCVQRLLVLGGLLIAGWLLGCAAQSAHADEPPPAQVVASTPVLRDAVTTVHEHEPVRRVVRAVAEKAPREEKPAPAASPPEQAEPVAVPKAAPPVTMAASTTIMHGRPEKTRVSRVSRARTTVAPASRHVVRHQRPPLPAPDRSGGTHSAVGGVVVPAVAAGFPVMATWALAPPLAQRPHVFGALPPAVRTAADEPSFAPD
ncbi:hypothetical protein E1293_24615 [Actinomadura darangshiensis]|uniref:Uncharacterized protein n=1 Tax=Actinomadura darangshiensis TaxID=705336 RepID=A0A4V2YUU5_9ACTN|nr:hypothetical protein [Actinomadura darangshiensis]TDD79037.1 hypothetical protein E1293_24615 [Actinomadura darangshiensis]